MSATARPSKIVPRAGDEAPTGKRAGRLQQRDGED